MRPFSLDQRPPVGSSWYTETVATRVSVRIGAEDLDQLDAAVARGRFASRSAALQEGISAILREENERATDDAYRRGYGRFPQDEWIGEVGLALFAASARAEIKP
jgi:Arc/MetJ-type ribon-helix-helix transcriptional regulator